MRFVAAKTQGRSGLGFRPFTLITSCIWGTGLHQDAGHDFLQGEDESIFRFKLDIMMRQFVDDAFHLLQIDFVERDILYLRVSGQVRFEHMEKMIEMSRKFGFAVLVILVVEELTSEPFSAKKWT